MTPQATLSAKPTFDCAQTLLQRVGQFTRCEVRSLAMVFALDSDVSEPAVLAFSAHGEAISPRFRHAMEMEQSFCLSVMDFADTEPPFYGVPQQIDMDSLAADAGVDRIFVLVMMTSDGKVIGARDYDFADMTEVEAANEQLVALINAMDPQPQASHYRGYRQ